MNKFQQFTLVAVAGALGGGAMVHYGKPIQVAPPAGVDQAVTESAPAGPGGTRSKADIVFERSKPVLRLVINGEGRFHQGKPTEIYVTMHRIYHESFYVGGQHGVTSGRQVDQELGSTSVKPDQIHNFAYVMEKIKKEQPTPTPTPEEQPE